MLENPCLPTGMAPRLEFLEYGALNAVTSSCRVTCRRRIVGCAFFNKHKVVVSTGYNGAPAGAPQCDQIGHLMVNGHCERTTHAERNAVLFAGDRDLAGGYAFVTSRPCQDCFPLLIEMKIKYIYYLEEYRSEEFDGAQRKICMEREMILEKLPYDVVALFQKALDFHQGPGGLLVEKNKLRIVEDIPEMMDH